MCALASCAMFFLLFATQKKITRKLLSEGSVPFSHTHAPSCSVLAADLIVGPHQSSLRIALGAQTNCSLSISWSRFANSLAYYGLSLNTGALVGNPYLMLFISGMIEVPAYLCSVRIIDILGRRPTISFCLAVGGLACIVTGYFPQCTYPSHVCGVVTAMKLERIHSKISLRVRRSH